MSSSSLFTFKRYGNVLIYVQPFIHFNQPYYDTYYSYVPPHLSPPPSKT
jgi:hypothetical protein